MSVLWLLGYSDCRSQVCVTLHRYPMIPLKPHNSSRNKNRIFLAQEPIFPDLFPPEYMGLYLLLGTITPPA